MSGWNQPGREGGGLARTDHSPSRSRALKFGSCFRLYSERLFVRAGVGLLLLVVLLFIVDSHCADPLLVHPALALTMSTSPLSHFLDTTKAAFLNDISTGNSLSNWVIIVGNEAGGNSTDPHC